MYCQYNSVAFAKCLKATEGIAGELCPGTSTELLLLHISAVCYFPESCDF